jgi:hypothetical protein
MHRRVLEGMPEPWFAYPPVQDHGSREDYYHCKKARAHGFRVFVDFDFECGHLATLPVTRELSAAWQSTAVGEEQLGLALRADTIDGTACELSPGGEAFEAPTV